jgi:hypothetical protein
MAFQTKFDSDAHGRLRVKPIPRVPIDRGLCFYVVARSPRLFDGWPTVKAYDYLTHEARVRNIVAHYPELDGMALDALFDHLGDAVARRRQDRMAAYARRVMQVME